MEANIVAIDLAIRQSGVVWVSESGELHEFSLIKLSPWKQASEYYNSIYRAFFGRLPLTQPNNTTNSKKKLILAIELSNFSNPKNTQRMSFIAGMIFQYYSEFCASHWKEIELKILNANDWFEHFNNEYLKIQDWTHLGREERKKYSIEYFEKVVEKNYEHNQRWKKLSFIEKSDIADAYWVGRYCNANSKK